MTKVRNITNLESTFIKVLVESADFEYKFIPSTYIKVGDAIKKNQLNAIINNLKSIGMLTTIDDLFDGRLIALSHRGKHAFRKILRDEANHI